MLRYFYRTVSAHWRTNPVLYGLTVLGVALGVASVISIRILNQSAIASFAAGVRTIGGGADVVVTGKGGTLPDEFFPRVRGTPGVAAAWPVFETTVAVEGKARDVRAAAGRRSAGARPGLLGGALGTPAESGDRSGGARPRLGGGDPGTGHGNGMEGGRPVPGP